MIHTFLVLLRNMVATAKPLRLAGLPVATILEIESGAGLVELGEIEALAWAFGMTLPALLVPPGRTAEERVVLALLEGE